MGTSNMNHSQIDKYNAMDNIPAMTSSQIHSYLEELGKTWTGQGSAMELGCWLGASSVALLKGLVQVNYDKPYWAYDAWIGTKDQIPKAKSQGVKIRMGENLMPVFLKNTKTTYSNIVTNRGLLPSTLSNYNQDPIEFCLFDAPKADPTFTMCVQKLSPFWIPGVTVLGLLDYNFYLRHSGSKREKFKAPVYFMEKMKDHFIIEKEWPDECVVFFRYIKKF